MITIAITTTITITINIAIMTAAVAVRGVLTIVAVVASCVGCLHSHISVRRWGWGHEQRSTATRTPYGGLHLHEVMSCSKYV